MADDKSPSPWSVVNDYTKTVVTVAAAFLAFTATFSAQLPNGGRTRWLLLISWFLFVAAIAAALFAAGRLTSFLEDSSRGRHGFLLSSNVAFFCLFAAVGIFFVYVLVASRNSDPDYESLTAGRRGASYISRTYPSLSSAPDQRSVEWNWVQRQWDLTYTLGADTFRIAYDPREDRVVRLSR